MSRKKRGKHEAKPAGKNSKKRKAIVIVLSVIIGLALVIGIAALVIVDRLYSKMNYDTGLSSEELEKAIEEFKQNEVENFLPEENPDGIVEIDAATAQEGIEQDIRENASELLSDDDVMNIMLIGSDARNDGSNSRSDAMILISINKKTEQIIMTSFMRDIYTYIPDAGYYNRLNVPNAIGGPAFLVNTIESVFGVDIDSYISVNFFSFIDAVDAAGGVDIDVTEGELEQLNHNLIEQNEVRGLSAGTDKLPYSQTGVIHLNGNQALAYSRIRAIGGDQQRTERQREVIMALIEKAKTLSITELYELVDTVLPMVTTDLTEADCFAIVLKAVDFVNYDIKSIRMPADGAYDFAMIDGMSVIKINFKTAKRVLQEEIYGITE